MARAAAYIRPGFSPVLVKYRSSFSQVLVKYQSITACLFRERPADPEDRRQAVKISRHRAEDPRRAESAAANRSGRMADQIRGLLDRERQRRQRAQRSRAGPLHEQHDRADQRKNTGGRGPAGTVSGYPRRCLHTFFRVVIFCASTKTKLKERRTK